MGNKVFSLNCSYIVVRIPRCAFSFALAVTSRGPISGCNIVRPKKGQNCRISRRPSAVGGHRLGRPILPESGAP